MSDSGADVDCGGSRRSGRMSESGFLALTGPGAPAARRGPRRKHEPRPQLDSRSLRVQVGLLVEALLGERRATEPEPPRGEGEFSLVPDQVEETAQGRPLRETRRRGQLQ